MTWVLYDMGKNSMGNNDMGTIGHGQEQQG
jgi:hypothetical protein